MALEVLVLDLQRGDLDLAHELSVGQGGVNVGELAPERSDHHVAYREPRDRMNRVNGPRAGGNFGGALRFGVGCHGGSYRYLRSGPQSAYTREGITDKTGGSSRQCPPP